MNLDVGQSTPPRRDEAPIDALLLGHFLRQVHEHNANANSQSPSECRPLPLHCDVATKLLAEYAWPLFPKTGEKVSPGMLEAFRRTHEFRGPCCFCPLIDGSDRYEETFIGITETFHPEKDLHRGLTGEYVAICSRQRCGYFLRLELFYSLDSLKTQACRRRGYVRRFQELARLPDLLADTNRFGLHQVLDYGATFVRDGKRHGLRAERLEMPRGEKDRLMYTFEKGMAEDEFWRTFVQCPECKIVMLRQGMDLAHKCRIPEANTLKRHHPYYGSRLHSSNLKSPPRLTSASHLAPGLIPGDIPETLTMRSMRMASRSPTPTEVSAPDA
ncbi:hypothetical protein NMY22_g13547 [Coprinellus aureogranulatus]|nr:hypothetical protein NMY22_g13547 [Coprinellus aureogranulatus]